ncbi:MAG: phosphatidylserine decarboxylase family protein [Elusimicrobia bacterium]|nr:phosphatidylserine decarboxylase family protein [Elusimicrobiota bacterium]
MRVSREILPVLLPVAAIFLASAIPMYFKPPKSFFLSWNFWLGGISFLVCLWLFVFFRDPHIEISPSADILLSPASGRILSVDEVNGNVCVRIFMSIFDYHIQRSPCDGTVVRTEYREGSFRNASSPLAHKENEQNSIMIKTAFGEVVVTQIAGAIARRILCWKKPGDSVKQGEKIGMIKFGSQVDCTFPSKIFSACVARGERVKCARTPIARRK